LALVVAAGLLAAPAAMATGSMSCTFTLDFEASAPCLVSVEDPENLPPPVNLACSAQGNYTGIKYTNKGNGLDHVATLVTRNNLSVVPVTTTGSQVYTAGTGDPVTGLGKYSAHEKAVKINGVPANAVFWILVPGRKLPIETSIVGKKNGSSCVKSMAIPGLGLDAPEASVTEVLRHGDCAVEFTLNAVTGTVISAKLTDDSPGTCTLHQTTTDQLNLELNEPFGDCATPPCPLGPGQFGNGYVQTGSASCTTRIVGGKVYTWGSPCPP
jgi:hypothetical protein